MIDFGDKILFLCLMWFKKTFQILPLDWKMYLPQQEKGRINEENYTGLKYKVYQDQVEGTFSQAEESD